MQGRAPVISAVERRSPAARLGLRPGDRLLSINGRPLADIVDYRFYESDARLALAVEHDGRIERLTVEKAAEEPLGLAFAEATFDGIRRCNNNCDFCFLKGLPRGMRSGVYIKDDDYRLSFLFGNFVTLTNLTERDWQRLEEQRLSPLYVSVHATDPEIRRRLLANAQAPEILPQLERLRDWGIQVHTQVVVTPGVNDGPHLARTVDELSRLHPNVLSIGVVPVGLTAHHGRGPSALRYGALPSYRDDPIGASQIIDAIEARQADLRHALGRGLVYASDEWYLLANRPLPPASAYDGFSQLENGIGMARDFMDTWRRALARRRTGTSRPAVLVTGALFAPVLAGLAREANGAGCGELEVVVAENGLFGASVTVAGLLGAEDVVRALERRAAPVARREPPMLILPRTMLNAAGTRTLDDVGPEELAARLGRRLVFAATPGQALGALRGPRRPGARVFGDELHRDDRLG